MTAVAWKDLPPEILAEAGVTVDARGRARVPYRLADGTSYVHKVFPSHARARAWYEPAGLDLIPFGLETLPTDPVRASRSVLLVGEGESGTLALRWAFGGQATPPVEAYYVLGIPGAGCWRPEWRSLLERFGLVYLLGDGDDAGRGLNWSIMRDLPLARPVRLPEGEDERSLLQRDGDRALDVLLDEADRMAALKVIFPVGEVACPVETVTDAEALLRGEEVHRAAR